MTASSHGCGIMHIETCARRKREMANNELGWTIWALHRACHEAGHIKFLHGRDHGLHVLMAACKDKFKTSASPTPR